MAGSSNNDDDGMVSGINVTPLVDITLVLLIIFMVTAKLIVSQSMPLDLPKTSQANSKEIQLIFGVELHVNGDTVVDGKKIANEEAVVPLAKEAQAKNPELRAIIRADAAVPHGRVMKVLDLMKTAGVNKIAFAVQPQSDPTPAGTAAPATSK